MFLHLNKKAKKKAKIMETINEINKMPFTISGTNISYLIFPDRAGMKYLPEFFGSLEMKNFAKVQIDVNLFKKHRNNYLISLTENLETILEKQTFKERMDAALKIKTYCLIEMICDQIDLVDSIETKNLLVEASIFDFDFLKKFL